MDGVFAFTVVSATTVLSAVLLIFVVFLGLDCAIIDVPKADTRAILKNKCLDIEAPD